MQLYAVLRWRIVFYSLHNTVVAMFTDRVLGPPAGGAAGPVIVSPVMFLVTVMVLGEIIMEAVILVEAVILL